MTQQPSTKKKPTWFKFFWGVHKWAGIVLAIFLLNLSLTGLLLLFKKKVDWIQPPTQEGASVEIEDFFTNNELFEIVLGQGHPDFQQPDDIVLVDFRARNGTFKVRSAHNHSEMQVCASTGAVFGVDFRASDLIQDIHDGEFFGNFTHDWIMPVVGVGLALMVGTGLYLFLQPLVRRRRRKRAPPDPAAVRQPARYGLPHNGRRGRGKMERRREGEKGRAPEEEPVSG